MLVYLNDVLLFASEAARLVSTIRKVLQLLIKARLKCKATQCSLFTVQVEYLIHIVTTDGIKPDPIKINNPWNKLN